MSCGDRLVEDLRQAGYRVTPQRAVILEAIAHNGGHRSAQEVFREAHRRLPGLNLATVYRTLDTLHRAGLLDMLSCRAELVRFALHDPAHPHTHLVCRSCDRVIELEPALIRSLAAALKRRDGFALDGDHLTLVGLCRACAGQQARSAVDRGG